MSVCPTLLVAISIVIYTHTIVGERKYETPYEFSLSLRLSGLTCGHTDSNNKTHSTVGDMAPERFTLQQMSHIIRQNYDILRISCPSVCLSDPACGHTNSNRNTPNCRADDIRKILENIENSMSQLRNRSHILSQCPFVRLYLWPY